MNRNDVSKEYQNMKNFPTRLNSLLTKKYNLEQIKEANNILDSYASLIETPYRCTISSTPFISK